MLHLFNKTYVCLEHLLDLSKRRIIISKRNHAHEASGLNYIKYRVSSFDELIGENSIFKTWHEFLLSLEHEEKFRCYVDMDAYNKFFVYWIKTIYPKLSTHLAFFIYNSYVQRFPLQFADFLMNDSFLNYEKRSLANFKFLGKKDFEDLYNNCIPWQNETDRKKWVDDHIESISLEWHIANFFNDKNHLKKFKDKYVQILVEALSVEVMEWYQYVVKYFMKPEVKKSLDLDISWDDENWIQKFKDHEILGWMFDEELRFLAKDPNYLMAHLKEALVVGKFLKEFWFKDIKVDDAIRLLDEDYFESDHAQFTFKTLELLSSSDFISDEKVEQIIASDIGRESVSILFDLHNKQDKWNIILIQLIYDLKENNKELLKELVINNV